MGEIYKGQSSLMRSLVSSWLGLGIAIAIGFFISPFVVQQLGMVSYGYWTIILSITTQLIMLDLGIRNAVVKYLAELRVNNQLEGISRLLSSAAALLLALAILGFALLLCLSFGLENLFEVPEQHASVVRVAFLIMSLEASIELAFGIFDASLAANERYDAINATNSLRLILQAVLILVVLSSGGGILGLAGVMFFSRVLQRLAAALISFKVIRGLSLRPGLVEKASVLKIARYGSWAAVITLCSRVIYNIDALVIGYVIGPVAVTFYAVPVIIIEMFRSLSQSSSTILAPRFSALSTLQKSSEIQEILFRWTSFASLLSITIGVPLIICGGDFLKLWMGPDFLSSQVLLTLLTLPFFVVLPAMGIGQLLLGVNKHSIYAKVMLIEALLNLVLSIWLIHLLGSVGVALATLLPSLVLRGLLLPFIAAREFSFSLFEYFKRTFSRTLPLATLYATVLIALRTYLSCNNWGLFVLTNSIASVSLLLAVRYFYLEKTELDYLGRRFPSLAKFVS